MIRKSFNQIANKFQHPLLRNAVSGSGSFVIISFMGLVITPFLVAYFGVEQYGIYILVTSVVGYYGIFDFGLGQGLIKFVSELNAQNMTSKLNDAVNSVFFVQLLIGMVLTAIIFVFSSNIIDLLRVSANYYNDSVIALKVAAFGFLFTMLAGTFSSAMRGLEYFGIVAIVDSISNLALNITLLIILLLHYGIKEAVWINVIVAFSQLILFLYYFKKFKITYIFTFKFDIKIIKNFLSFSLYLFLSKISSIFANYVVRFVISFFLGPSAVTYYVVPSKLLGAFGGVLSSAANAIFPYTTRLFTLGKNEKIKNSFIKSSILFAAFSIPISTFIILFSRPIMISWMGLQFANESWLVLSIISLSGTIGSFSAIPNLVILGLGNSKLIGVFSTITIILYIIFLPIFTKYFGLIGASSALLITSLSVIGYVIYKTTKVIGINYKELISKVYKVHLLPILIITSVYLLMQKFFEFTPLIELVVGIFIVLVYYLYLMKNKIFYF